jgi:hypothetical protein
MLLLWPCDSPMEGLQPSEGEGQTNLEEMGQVVLLELFIGIVDTQLLKAVVFADLKSENIHKTCKQQSIMASKFILFC